MTKMISQSAKNREWEDYIDSLWAELRDVKNIREDEAAHMMLEELLDNLTSYDGEIDLIVPAKGVH